MDKEKCKFDHESFVRFAGIRGLSAGCMCDCVSRTGCNMAYGPGASARLWRKYLPHAEIWFAEYNTECVKEKMPEIKALNISVVTGKRHVLVIQRKQANPFVTHMPKLGLNAIMYRRVCCLCKCVDSSGVQSNAEC